MSIAKTAKVDYFPHTVNHGKSMYAIEGKYGNLGYAFWFKTLELLGSTENHFIDCNDTATFQYLITRSHTDEEKATEIIEYLVSLGCLDSDFWNCKIIWSQNFVDNMLDLYNRRKVKCYTKAELMGYLETLYPLSGAKCNNQPQRKGKESKGEEKREPPDKPADVNTDDKPKKIEYDKSVLMTEVEYDKLIAKHGEHKTKAAIEKLKNYKLSSGKKYKSDYHAILNWVMDEVIKKEPKQKETLDIADRRLPPPKIMEG